MQNLKIIFNNSKYFFYGENVFQHSFSIVLDFIAWYLNTLIITVKNLSTHFVILEINCWMSLKEQHPPA